MEDDWIVLTRLFAKCLASFIIKVVDGVGLWNDFGGIPLDLCFFLFGLSSPSSSSSSAEQLPAVFLFLLVLVLLVLVLLLLFGSLFESEESLHDLDEQALTNESSAESYILSF